MKNTNKVVVLVAFAAALSLSCQREILKPEIPGEFEKSTGNLPGTGLEVNSPKVINGYLAFPDLKAFGKTMESLQKEGMNLSSWEKQFQGYQSLRAVQEIAKESEETTSVPSWNTADIPDPYFRAVLNNSGRIQIADTLYQFEPGKEKGIAYAIPQASIGQVVTGSIKPSAVKGVVIHHTTMTLLPFPRWADDPIRIDDPSSWNLCQFPGSFMMPWWGQKGGSIFHDDNGVELPRDNGRRIRIDYHRWRVGYIFYSSIGIRVKIYKDTRLGGWLSNIKMDKVFMEGCTKGQIITPGLGPLSFHENATISATNTNELEKTLKWSAAPMHTEIIPEHFNFHFKADFRTKHVERYIKE